VTSHYSLRVVEDGSETLVPEIPDFAEARRRYFDARAAALANNVRDFVVEVRNGTQEPLLKVEHRTVARSTGSTK